MGPKVADFLDHSIMTIRLMIGSWSSLVVSITLGVLSRDFRLRSTEQFNML
jgi:hypothetical protein